MAGGILILFSFAVLITAHEHARNNRLWTGDEDLIPQNCLDIQRAGHTANGIYTISPFPEDPQNNVKVYCDMKTSGGGWTVIQRRDDIQPRENFNRTWGEYERGFGDMNGEFWLGLKYIHVLTHQVPMEIRFDMADFENNFRYAEYGLFYVHDVNEFYRMVVTDFTGDAGDSFTYHSENYFTTKDQDHDQHEACCSILCGGGWWYNNCYHSNLNGVYLSGKSGNETGVSWYTWLGTRYSLKFTEMKIRPVDD